MDSIYVLALVVLGGLEIAAFYYLWKTNRRLDAVAEELRARIDAARSELDEKCRILNRRIDELAEELRERTGSSYPFLEEGVGIDGRLGDPRDVPVATQCVRAPGGLSRKMRRSDHRQ